MIGKQQDIHQNDMCSICLSVFYKPNSLNTCKHVFCQPCIDQASDLYEQKNCPLCRTQFSNQDKILEEERHQQLKKMYPQMIKSRIDLLKKDKLYRMEIGNITQVLNTKSNNKYRWKLFVKPAPGQQGLQKFVQKVEIKLHPTFDQTNVVFSGDEQIQLQRVGWGTFRIEIKIILKKQYGGFVQAFHDLTFRPKASKILTCKIATPY